MSARVHAAWAAALLALAALSPARAHADASWHDVALDACVEAALPALHPEPFLRAFLIDAAARSRAFTPTNDGCVSFVAVGGRGILAVELGVHTVDGGTLATDARIGPSARLRYCGVPDLPVVLTAQVKAGQGTLQVLRIDRDLRHLGAELAALDACQRGGAGPRGALPYVGGAPPAADALEWLAARHPDEVDAGGELVGPPLTMQLEEHETARTPFRREEAGCYVVIAAGDEGVHALSASVERRDGVTFARTQRDRASARLSFCIDTPGRFALSVRATSGRGAVATRWLRFPEPVGARPAGLEGGARARFARIAAQMRTYGLVARPHAWVHLRSTERIVAPLTLAAGACIALDTVAADSDARVALGVESAEGRLLAVRASGEIARLVHGCADRAQTLRIAMTSTSSYPTASLLVVGEASP